TLSTLRGPRKESAPAPAPGGLPVFSSASIRGIHFTLRSSTKRAAILGAFDRSDVSPAHSALVSPFRQALYILPDSLSPLSGGSSTPCNKNWTSPSATP